MGRRMHLSPGIFGTLPNSHFTIFSGSADSGAHSSGPNASFILCSRAVLRYTIESTKTTKLNPTVDTSPLFSTSGMCLLGRVIFRHQRLFHLWWCGVIKFSGTGCFQLGSRVGHFLPALWIEIYNRRIRSGTVLLCHGTNHNIPYICNGHTLFQKARWNSR